MVFHVIARAMYFMKPRSGKKASGALLHCPQFPRGSRHVSSRTILQCAESRNAWVFMCQNDLLSFDTLRIAPTCFLHVSSMKLVFMSNATNQPYGGFRQGGYLKMDGL